MDVSCLDPKYDMKNKDLLYRLIISQLFYDGFQSVAVSLSNIIQAQPPCPPSDRLLKVMNLGLPIVEANNKPKKKAESLAGPGIDLEFETEVQVCAPDLFSYEPVMFTSHKGHCRSGAFSHDGQFCATGSVDAVIKILDVERMLTKSIPDMMDSNSSDPQGHCVIRTLCDHYDEVTCLEFHPKEQILASGSRDHTIKLFSYSKASVKKAFRTITDTDEILSISLHPTGDFMVVGTTDNVIRLYDVNTAQCYSCSTPFHHHSGAVYAVKYSFDGKYYLSCSQDGAVKVWDGVSNKCVNTLHSAHEGAEVTSVTFSRNGKYILSSGKDCGIKLWEVSTSRCLVSYPNTGKKEQHARAIFNHTEDYVLYPDESSGNLLVWDARNATRKQSVPLGHSAAVHHIVHSPCRPVFLTCSDDFRARCWFKRLPTM